MKQFLIFGLLVLIQVNFITCKYSYGQNYQDLDDGYNSDYEVLYSDEDVEDPWESSEEEFGDDDDDDQQFVDNSEFITNQIGQTDTQNNIQQEPWYESNKPAVPQYNYNYQQEEDPGNSFQNYIRRRRSLDFPEAAAARSKRQDDWYISACTRAECRSRSDGSRALKKCGPAYCTCHNGNAYLQGCAIGLIYHAEKRLCTWHYNVPGC